MSGSLVKRKPFLKDQSRSRSLETPSSSTQGQRFLVTLWEPRTLNYRGLAMIQLIVYAVRFRCILVQQPEALRSAVSHAIRALVLFWRWVTQRIPEVYGLFHATHLDQHQTCSQGSLLGHCRV